METPPVEEIQHAQPAAEKKFFTKDILATIVIIAVNILVFVLMVLQGADMMWPDTQILLNWGADYRLYTLDGQPWRLFTSIFVHIGIIHLLMNMYALYFIGKKLEPLLGSTRFVVVYIACGIVSSLSSIAMHDSMVSAGASGAIFGMYGVYVALLLTKAIDIADQKKTMYNMLAFVAYNLFFGFTVEMIDNAGHVGGLVAGFLIGYFCKSDLAKEEGYRKGYMNLVFMGIAVIGITWMGMSLIPNNIKYYMEQMKIFDSRQSEALSVYNHISDGTKEDRLYEINERGVYYWEENLKVLNNLEKVSLPEEIEARNKELKRYCNLRIECYLLMGKAISEETVKYQPEIERINKEIQYLIASLEK